MEICKCKLVKKLIYFRYAKRIRNDDASEIGYIEVLKWRTAI